MIPAALVVLLCSTAAAAGGGMYLGGALLYTDPLSDINALSPGPGIGLKFGYDFGSGAFEAAFTGSRHDDAGTGTGEADFRGFSLDLRLFLSPGSDPDRVYLLIGLGNYALGEFDPARAAGATLRGSGWDLGAGLEHDLGGRVSLDFGVIYRIIRYSEVQAGGALSALGYEVKGDMLAVEAGMNYHF